MSEISQSMPQEIATPQRRPVLSASELNAAEIGIELSPPSSINRSQSQGMGVDVDEFDIYDLDQDGVLDEVEQQTRAVDRTNAATHENKIISGRSYQSVTLSKLPFICGDECGRQNCPKVDINAVLDSVVEIVNFHKTSVSDPVEILQKYFMLYLKSSSDNQVRILENAAYEELFPSEVFGGLIADTAKVRIELQTARSQEAPVAFLAAVLIDELSVELADQAVAPALEDAADGEERDYNCDAEFDRLDTDGDGVLSKEEYLAAYGEEMTTPDEAEIADEFALGFGVVDSDNNGAISKSEFVDMVSAFGPRQVRASRTRCPLVAASAASTAASSPANLLTSLPISPITLATCSMHTILAASTKLHCCLHLSS